MNLYFLDSTGNKELVKENVEPLRVIEEALNWMKDKGYYDADLTRPPQLRTWWDVYDRYWIDIGLMSLRGSFLVMEEHVKLNCNKDYCEIGGTEDGTATE